MLGTPHLIQEVDIGQNALQHISVPHLLTSYIPNIKSIHLLGAEFVVMKISQSFHMVKNGEVPQNEQQQKLLTMYISPV